ncbi:MAG: 3'-5' exonuclease [Magnetococcales bacterium]|nr:3'-5' exonuclease [Magnetococcales bacterium]
MNLWRSVRDRLAQRRLTDQRFAFLFDSRPHSDEIICFDTETTSLDINRAELLSIGAVPVLGNRILLSRRLKLLVRPSGPLEPDNIRIHGLRPCDVAGGIPVAEAIQQFLHYIGNRPLMGYYLEFDTAIINKYVVPWLGVALPNPRIEVSSLYHDHAIGLIPNKPIDLSFKAILHALNITSYDQHDALSDAIATALIYIKLQQKTG